MTGSEDLQDGLRSMNESLTDERIRLADLDRLQILDTEPEPAYDRIVELAAKLFQAPAAFLTFIDGQRQWIKSAFGMPGRETCREDSFCDLTIRQADVLVVPDTLKDERFRGNPFVTGAPGIRFYAGAPLRRPHGMAYGSLCVIDTAPRAALSGEQKSALLELAELVSQNLDYRRVKSALRQPKIKARSRQAILKTLAAALTKAQTQFLLNGPPALIFQTLLESVLRGAKSSHGLLVKLKPGPLKQGNVYQVFAAVEDAGLIQPPGDNQSGPRLLEIFDRVMATGDLFVGENVQWQNPNNPRKPASPDVLRSVVVFPCAADTGAPVETEDRQTHTNNIVCLVVVGNRHSKCEHHAAEPLRQSLSQLASLVELSEAKERRIRELHAVRLRDQTLSQISNAVIKIDLSTGTPSILDSADEMSVNGRFFADLDAFPASSPPSNFSGQLLALAEETGRTHSPVEKIVCAPQPDGSIASYEFKTSPVFDHRGHVSQVIAVGNDVTERLRSERAMHEMLAFQQVVVNATRLAMIWATADCVVKIFNGAAQRLLGYASAEVVGVRHNRLFCALEDQAGQGTAEAGVVLETASIPEFVGEKAVCEFECPMIRKDGSRFPALLTVYRLSAGNPALDGYLIVAGDLTLKKRTEDAAREEKRFSETLITNSQEGIFAIDNTFRITVWNPGCEGTAGIRSRDAVGANLLDLFPELLGNGEVDRMKAALRGKIMSPVEETFAIRSRSNYVQRHYSSSYTEIKAESGEIAGLLGIWHDVSNLKIAEDGLLREKEFSEALIRSSNDGIFAVDRHYCITEWNPGVEAMSGVKREDALGRIALDLHPVLYHNGEADRLAEALEGGQTVGADQRYRLPGKGTRYYSTRYSALRNSADQIVGALGIVRDISDSKIVESELRRSKEAAETADKAKTRFLANMSHEIRTPMNAIIGLSTILLDTDLSADQRKYVDTVRLAAQGLLAIINQILDFSKLSSSHFEFENLPLSLRSCIDGALDLIWTSATAKSLTVDCNIDPQVPETIIGDGTRLRQILLNLLGNAVKFTEKGKIGITVKARPKEGNLWEVHFAVRDSGIGIPAEKVSSLFKPFHQADSSTTRKYGGTGLGLAISKQLAEQMGGKIWVETDLGKGSTFQFTILAESQSVAPKEPVETVEAVQSKLAGHRALIIDAGDPHSMELWKQLPSWSMDMPTVFSSLEEVRGCGTKGFFDVVIVDRDLPDVSLREINQLLPKKVPFLLVHSAGKLDHLSSEEAAYLEEQPVLFLAKPVEASKLRETLNSLYLNDPASPPAGKPREASDQEFRNRKPLRLLVAEDHPVNQMLTLLLLSRLGYKAQVANNGLEVLSALEKDKFDVIFMDMQMPEMDGVETTRTIHRLMSAAERPWIIALTANAMSSDREICQQAGMQDFVTKPVELGDIRRALERVPGEHVRVVEAPVQDSAPSGKAWNRPESLVQVFNEEPELGRQLVDMFLEDARSRLATLQAMQSNQKAAVLLHGLQGSFRQIGAGPAGALAMKLEKEARAAADPEAAFVDFKELAISCQVVFQEIEEFLSSLNSSQTEFYEE